MIQGVQLWAVALAQKAKQPLYMLVIPDWDIALTSFTPAQQPDSLASANSGYGKVTYGVAGYGT